MSLKESIETVKAEINAVEEEKRRQAEVAEQAKATADLKKMVQNGIRMEKCQEMLEESQIGKLFDDFNNDYLGGIGTFSEAANLVEKTKTSWSLIELTEYTYAQYLHGIVNGVPVKLMAQAYIAEMPDENDFTKVQPPHLIISCLAGEEKKPGFMDKILRRKFIEKPASQRCLWTVKTEPEEVESLVTGKTVTVGVPGEIKEWQNFSLVSRYLAEVLIEQKVV